MKQIRQWLESEGRDYAHGVALYEAHGRSAVVLRLLQHGATSYSRAKLVQVLTALVDESPVPIPQPPSATPTKADESRTIDPQRRDWLAERNHLHAQLELVATKAERCEMALRILALGDLIRQSYDQAAGRAPAPVPEPHPTPALTDLTDAGEIRRLLANLRPQRSKLKKRPDRAADLAAVEAAIYLLETKLQSHE